MPRGKLILVRHGETAANALRIFADDEIPLTETGILQAEQVARRLAREFSPDVLVSSHFLRARQTSEIIGRALDLAPEPIAGIHERDFGDLKGHPYARMAEAPHSAETFDSVRRRAVAAIEALRERYPCHQIVVVSHGAVIQSICAHVTGVWSEASVLPNCGLVVIEYDENCWRPPILSDEWEQIISSPVPDKPQS